jgi:serine/threonine-protein kinase
MTARGGNGRGQQAPVKEGETLAGKYRVERVLGVGGMGVVVAATHLELDQKVAIKFLLPSALESEEAGSRFQREAKAASRLKSSHVAKVLDVGKLEDGSPYMVMEYLDGLDLGRIIKELNQLAVEDAVWFVVQACEAIAEAHALGIIHRDIKPQNLFVTKRVDGRALVKVLDFGISKNISGESAMSLTRTTSVMGSPLYMSPEQMRSSKNVDVRSDIWALGVILYELLTGRVPFEAEAVPELCLKVVSDPATPPHELRADMPEALSAVVIKCLEKLPERRFQNVAELVAALDPFCPASERGAAERIANVLKVVTTSQPSFPASDVARSNPKVKTDVSWGRDSKPQSKPFFADRKNQIGVVVAVALLCAVGVAIRIGLKKKDPETAAPSATITSAPPPQSPPTQTMSIAPLAPTTATPPTAMETSTATTAAVVGVHTAKPPASGKPVAAAKDGGGASPAVTAPPKGFND